MLRRHFLLFNNGLSPRRGTEKIASRRCAPAFDTLTCFAQTGRAYDRAEASIDSIREDRDEADATLSAVYKHPQKKNLTPHR